MFTASSVSGCLCQSALKLLITEQSKWRYATSVSVHTWFWQQRRHCLVSSCNRRHCLLRLTDWPSSRRSRAPSYTRHRASVAGSIVRHCNIYHTNAIQVNVGIYSWWWTTSSSNSNCSSSAWGQVYLNSALHPPGVAKSNTSLAGAKAGMSPLLGGR